MRSKTQWLRGWGAMLVVTAWMMWTPAAACASADSLPAPAAALLVQARELMNRKAYGQAIEKISAFQAKGGAASKSDDSDGHHHPVVYFVLGNCHLLKNDPERAKDAFQKALAANPDYVEAVLNLAVAHYELKAWAQAARCYAQAYSMSNATHPEYLYYSATAYMIDQKYEPAVAAFDALFKDHPGRVERCWRENYAHALTAAGQPRKALPLVQTLAETAPEKDRSQWFEALLHLYIQLDMSDQAVEAARYLARADCADAKWWKALAHVHLARKQYRDALAALTIYGYLTPLSGEEQKLAADICLQVGVPAQAIPLYQKMLADNPQKPMLQNLIAAYRQLDRHQEALAELDRYRSNGQDADIVMLKADVLYALNRFDEAESAYRQVAQAKNRQAGLAWLMAGYAAWQIKDVKASRHAFTEAAQYPEHRTAALQAMSQLTPALEQAEHQKKSDG